MPKKVFFCCELETSKEPCLFIETSEEDVLEHVNNRRAEYGNDSETKYNTFFELNEDSLQVSLYVLEAEI